MLTHSNLVLKKDVLMCKLGFFVGFCLFGWLWGFLPPRTKQQQEAGIKSDYLVSLWELQFSCTVISSNPAINP